MMAELLTAAEQAEADRARLARLSAASKEHDAVLVEVLYGDKWVRFDLSAMQLQHVADVARDHFARALVDVGAPPPVTAD